MSHTPLDSHTFLTHFAESFEEETPESLSMELEFRQLGEWSSMHALMIIAMIDSEYDVSISAEELRNAQKIQDLFGLVEQKLKA